MVLSSTYSQKTGQRHRIVGELTQDRHSGIMGIWAAVEMIPVSVNFRSSAFRAPRPAKNSSASMCSSIRNGHPT